MSKPAHAAARLYARLRDHPRLTLALLAGLCAAVFVATIPLPRVDGLLIGSDGIGYYMYTRSLLIDGDLDFANEYARLDPTADLEALRTPSGRVGNQYAIGPGLLWAPFFAAAYALSRLLQLLGLPVSTDGYGTLFQAAVCLGSLVYGAIGMGLIHHTVRRFHPSTALAATLVLWLASPVIYYLVVEPSMSHMCSLFATALLVALWVRERHAAGLRPWLALGLAGGLVATVRQPDATLLLLPVADLLLRPGSAGLKAQRLLVLGLGFLAVFWVQLAAWAVLNGSPLVSGYLSDGRQGFSWLQPRLLEVLFSTEHGLFLWHPALLAAVAGWALLWRTRRGFTTLLVIGFLTQAYLIAAWSSWSQGDAFGGRMFIASLPLLAPGLSAALDWVRTRGWQRAAWMAALSLIAWNGLTLVQYRLGFISMSGPYTVRELTLGKLDMLAQLGRVAARFFQP